MIRNHSLSLPSSGISLFLFFTRQRFLYFVIVIADSYSEQRTHLTRQKFTDIIPYRLKQCLSVCALCFIVFISLSPSWMPSLPLLPPRPE